MIKMINEIKVTKKTGVSNAAVLILLCVFIIMVFTVLVMSIGAYQKITNASAEGYEERLCLSYIRTKIKHGDEAGMVHIGEFHGLPALFIDAEYGGELHRTAIYNYDGRLYELFFEAGREFHPRDGLPVVKNNELQFRRLENNMLEISAGNYNIVISLRAS